jgi:hypothetical protein
VAAVASDRTLSRALGKEPLGAEQAGSENVSFRVARLERDQLPLELLAYQGLDALYLGDLALEELDEARRRVVEAYLVTGGRVALGRCTPSTLAHLPLLAHAPNRSGPVRYGFGELLWCDASIVQLSEFFGHATELVAAPRMNTSSSSLPDGWALLPEVTPPVGRFFFIVLAFGLAVGPGSYWVARRRGSAVLLATIPLTALLTCAVIIVSALVGDGLVTRASTRSFTLLDRQNGRAVSVALAGFFAGVTPGDLPVANSAAWAFQPGSLYLREGGLLRRGFIPPRRYIEWSLASVLSTRARVVVRQRGQEIRVQNALGVPLSEIFLRHGQRLYVVRQLADGQEAIAAPASAVGLDISNWPLRGLTRNQMTSPLGEGEFVASVNGAPFLPLGELPLQHRGSVGLIRGEVTP